ncbi:MAG: alpha/beta hydrolase [Rikenellaceae bacterium]|nr:alpha/beta hydrolase [Rikenellaceae bacterium]
MEFRIYGSADAPSLMLIPGLGVSHELFLPLIDLLKSHFHIIAVEVDGFTVGHHTEFTTVEDQATQAINYIKTELKGYLDCAYGLSLGGKILSHILSCGEVIVGHAVMDAAPLLPLPKWLVKPLAGYQSLNVWSCYHWRGMWRMVFRSHYFGVLLDECRKTFPWGGRRAVIDGYHSVYTTKLERICGGDVHYWYGTKESFVAKPQSEHLLKLCPNAHIEVFPKMNHGQLLIDHPLEVASRIINLLN